MGTTFLKPAPRPDDGLWLTQNGPSKRLHGGRWKKPEGSSFLFQAADRGYDAEDEDEGVELGQESFLRPTCEIGKERMSHGIDACKHEPRAVTIGIENLLSPTMWNSSQPPQPAQHTPCTTATDQADANRSQHSSALSNSKTSPPISDTMALPPHLRPRKAHSTSQTSKDKPTGDPAQPHETPPPDTMPPKRTAKDKVKSNPVNTNGQKQPSQPTTTSSVTFGVNIREKLKQDHGVKVDDPKPATESPKSLVPYPSSNEDEGRQANIATSKRTTRSSGARLNPGLSNRLQPKDDALQQSSKRAGRNEGRGRGNAPAIRAPPAPRTSRWPKNSEMRADHRPLDKKCDEQSAHDSIDSARADSGVGEKKYKRKDIDSETGFKLTGWDGDWAPVSTASCLTISIPLYL